MKKIILVTLLLAFPLVCFAQDATTQATPKHEPLQLTIKSDKEVYEVGEGIKIKMDIKNTYDRPMVLIEEFMGLEVKDKSNCINFIQPFSQAQPSPPILGKATKIKLKPSSNYTKVFDFGRWEINIQEKGDNLGALYHIYEFPNHYRITGVYKCTVEKLERYSNTSASQDKEILKCGFTSNTITIEVKEKNASLTQTYSMELKFNRNAKKHWWTFKLGEKEFGTLEKMKKFIKSIPKGSKIKWAPGCIHMGDEPLLYSETEMESFKKFCEDNGITLVFIPSG